MFRLFLNLHKLWICQSTGQAASPRKSGVQSTRCKHQTILALTPIPGADLNTVLCYAEFPRLDAALLRARSSQQLGLEQRRGYAAANRVAAPERNRPARWSVRCF